MKRPGTSTQIDALQTDALLLPFLRAVDGAEAESLLAQLLAEHVEPLIRQVIHYKLRAHFDRDGKPSDGGLLSQDAEDVRSEVLLHLLAFLQNCKIAPQEKAIGNLRSYVVVATSRACYEYLRRKYPRRWRLKNRLRYLLTHQARFALWESDDKEWFGGLAAWPGRKPTATHQARLHQLRDRPQAWEQVGLSSDELQRLNPAEVVSAIFKQVGGPIELDDLVNLTAEWWGIKDHTAALDTDEEEAEDWRERLPDPRVDVAAEVDQRFYLRQLWEEVIQLPLRQRTALLLNLRDEQGGGIIELLPLTGVATLRAIAAALEMTAEQFASLWHQLPLEDAAIAKLLGATRQQVINLRKSARERLARRMSAREEEAVVKKK